MSAMMIDFFAHMGWVWDRKRMSKEVWQYFYEIICLLAIKNQVFFMHVLCPSLNVFIT